MINDRPRGTEVFPRTATGSDTPLKHKAVEKQRLQRPPRFRLTPKAGHLMSAYVFLMSVSVQRVPGNWCLYSMPNKHFYSCCYKSKRRTSAVEVARIPKCSRTSLIPHGH